MYSLKGVYLYTWRLIHLYSWVESAAYALVYYSGVERHFEQQGGTPEDLCLSKNLKAGRFLMSHASLRQNWPSGFRAKGS